MAYSWGALFPSDTDNLTMAAWVSMLVVVGGRIGLDGVFLSVPLPIKVRFCG